MLPFAGSLDPREAAVSLALDPKTTVVLVMDYQNGVVPYVTGAEALFARAAGALDACRRAQLPIIYVVVGFRPGYPEVSPQNAMFAALRTHGRFVSGTPDTQVPATVAPREGETVITKKRVSAFAGSDLEVLLRAHGATTLVMMGIATSGVVLSTLTQAVDLDYRCLVIKDCCADRDDELHRVLTEKYFPGRGTVLTAQDLIAQLG